MPNAPGVYRFLAADGEVLYVGKALSLKKRVADYSRPGSAKISRMLSVATDLTFSPTANESEALLLENNLIKEFKPRYNVLLKDDKSYPYIRLGGGDWSRVSVYRGRKTGGEFFGPYASAGAVKRAMRVLEKAFLLRTCSDSVFADRSRPCLLYQIKRCSAPCVGKINREDYEASLEQARQFLNGKSSHLQARMAKEMQKAATRRDFEKAALLRDRLAALSKVQSSQEVELRGNADADIIGLAEDCSRLRVIFFRNGRRVGEMDFTPRPTAGLSKDGGEILSAFLSQFYANRPPPKTVVLSENANEVELHCRALGQKRRAKVKIICPRRGRWRQLAMRAGREAAKPKHRKTAPMMAPPSSPEWIPGLSRSPNSVEVFDNSHLGGSGAVGVVAVFDDKGAVRSRWRRYNIKNRQIRGDDVGMMKEVFTRRFSKPGAQPPDLIVIDGGRGQYNAAADVFRKLGLARPAMVAMAKGKKRKSGNERFYGASGEIVLPAAHPLRLYLTFLRDEAHKFANRSSERRRLKASLRSELEEIPNIGKVRRRALLNHFGSVRAVRAASVADINRVSGISRNLADEVYSNLHRASRR